MKNRTYNPKYQKIKCDYCKYCIKSLIPCKYSLNRVFSAYKDICNLSVTQSNSTVNI